MSSSHQPYNTPNTNVGTNTSSSGATPPPYQHWLDDAAQMGLMLYRMRNDSKRERMFRNHPPMVVRTSPPAPPPSSPAPQPMVLRDATPRTSAALQVPTVATQNNSAPQPPSQPPHFHLPLD